VLSCRRPLSVESNDFVFAGDEKLNPESFTVSGVVRAKRDDPFWQQPHIKRNFPAGEDTRVFGRTRIVQPQLAGFGRLPELECKISPEGRFSIVGLPRGRVKIRVDFYGNEKEIEVDVPLAHGKELLIDIP